MLYSRPNINHYTKNQLIEYYNQQANEYEDGIITGAIISNQWMKLAVQREIDLRQKYIYNQKKVDSLFAKLFYFNIKPKQRLHLMPWQCWVIKCLYGLEDKEGFRLRTDALLYMAKKNAKTATSAFLMLLHLFDSKGIDNNIYLFATKHKQADLALKECKKYISYSPSLQSRCSKTFYNVKHNTSTIYCMSGNPDLIEGTNPNVVLLDESHLHKTREIYENCKTAQIFQREKLIIEISTAGFNKSLPFFDVVERSKDVLNGIFVQDTWFIALYCLDDETDIDNPLLWEKSNPSLGYCLDLDKLKDDYEISLNNTSQYNSFVVKNLNYYLNCSVNHWIDDSMIVDNMQVLDINDFKDCKAWMGLDLSATRDLTALSLVVEKEDKYYFFTDFFYPNNPNNTVRKQQGFSIDISQWLEGGYIRQHQTKVIDYDDVLNRIDYYSKIVDLQIVGYDRWQIGSILNQLLTLYDVAQCPQTTEFFNTPMREFERYLFNDEQKLIIDQNPVLRWNFNNVVVFQDNSNCIKISKNKSSDSVDGCISMMVAFGTMLKDIQNNYIKQNDLQLQKQLYKNNRNE